jgi:HSP90 family molecular chaperone
MEIHKPLKNNDLVKDKKSFCSKLFCCLPDEKKEFYKKVSNLEKDFQKFVKNSVKNNSSTSEILGLSDVFFTQNKNKFQIFKNKTKEEIDAFCSEYIDNLKIKSSDIREFLAITFFGTIILNLNKI